MSDKKLSGPSALKGNDTKSMAKAGSFKPKDILHIDDKDENYVGRWLSVKKMEQNGWADPRGYEVVTGLTKVKDKEDGNKGFVDSVHSLDGTLRRGDLVYARMPKELAEQRKEYFRGKTKQREELLNTKSKLHGVDGKVEFRSQRGHKVEEY